MAFSAATCRTAIETLLTALDPPVGRVHPQRHLLTNDKVIKDLCVDPSTAGIRVWFISPASFGTMTTERHPGNRGIGSQGGGNDLTEFRFQVEGYQAISEETDSEQGFTDLAWRVCLELNDYGVIPNTGGAHSQTAAQVEQFGYANLAQKYLCHYARLSFGLTGRTRPR